MQATPEVRSRLVQILYSAMPQVASSTFGTVLLAGTVWWRVPSTWSASLIAAAAVLAFIRLGLLVAYRRKHADDPAPPAEAIRWERRYGVFSIAMALVLSAVVLTAFRLGDSGNQLIALGVAVGICGGQSTARVTCCPWISLSSGTIILSTLFTCALTWNDSFWPLLTLFSGLYLYTYSEACRHSARTILGRLVAESELAILARRDALTGLANRMGFEEEIARALLALRRTNGAVSLLMLDLDGFKAVNDGLGHPAGDAVLHEVAQRLRGLARQSDYLARLGGDEFAILVADPHDLDGLSLFANRLIAGLSDPFVIAGTVARIGVSIGIGTAHAHTPVQPGDLLADTDSALYTVKKAAKNGFAFAVPRPPTPTLRAA